MEKEIISILHRLVLRREEELKEIRNRILEIVEQGIQDETSSEEIIVKILDSLKINLLTKQQ